MPILPVISKRIVFLGQDVVVACDGRCDKAWGQSSRPHLLSRHDGDHAVFLADGELARAPLDPGTYEGADAKPREPDERLNKWCVRECERSNFAPTLDDVELRDFSRRVER